MTKSPLSSRARRYLSALAHALEAVVQIGHRGATGAVVAQLDGALTAHELVKVRLARECPQTKDEVLAAIAAGTGAALVQSLGRTVVVYRAHPEQPKIELPGEGEPAGTKAARPNPGFTPAKPRRAAPAKPRGAGPKAKPRGAGPKAKPRRTAPSRPTPGGALAKPTPGGALAEPRATSAKPGRAKPGRAKPGRAKPGRAKKAGPRRGHAAGRRTNRR